MSENKEPDKVFKVDRIAGQWAEIEALHKTVARAKRELDKYKALLKEVAGKATEFTLRGHTVANLVPGQLNKSLLAKEQPDIVEKYTRQVIRTEFDQVAFANEMPEVFKQYRAQRLVFTGDNGDE